MLAIASQVPTPRTHLVNECLVPVSNELKSKGGIAGEDSLGAFAATRVLRVAIGGSERGSAVSNRTGVPAVGTVAVCLVPGGHAYPRAPPKAILSCRARATTSRSRCMMIVAGLADQRGNAVEFFLRVVVDDDLPPLGRFGCGSAPLAGRRSRRHSSRAGRTAPVHRCSNCGA